MSSEVLVRELPDREGDRQRVGFCLPNYGDRKRWERD